MSDTNFVNGVTLTDAAWFQDLNDLFYKKLASPATSTAIFNAIQVHGADIPTTSTTLNLQTATGYLVDLTGAATVSSIALNDGQFRIGRFTGAATLVNSGTLVLPGAANIVTAAGDFAIFAGYGTSTRLVNYSRALGSSVVSTALGADVALSTTAQFFTGPSIAQGTVGQWDVKGSVILNDTSAAATFIVKLWDGTTVLASANVNTNGANFRVSASLAGIISNPAGNLRISVKDATTTNGAINFNIGGDSRDSVIYATRIG